MTISNEVVSIRHVEVSSTAFTQPWDSHIHTCVYLICIALKQKWKQIIKKIKHNKQQHRINILLVIKTPQMHHGWSMCATTTAPPSKAGNTRGRPIGVEYLFKWTQSIFAFIWIDTQGQCSTPHPAHSSIHRHIYTLEARSIRALCSCTHMHTPSSTAHKCFFQSVCTLVLNYAKWPHS